MLQESVRVVITPVKSKWKRFALPAVYYPDTGDFPLSSQARNHRCTGIVGGDPPPSPIEPFIDRVQSWQCKDCAKPRLHTPLIQLCTHCGKLKFRARLDIG